MELWRDEHLADQPREASSASFGISRFEAVHTAMLDLDSSGLVRVEADSARI